MIKPCANQVTLAFEVGVSQVDFPPSQVLNPRVWMYYLLNPVPTNVCSLGKCHIFMQ